MRIFIIGLISFFLMCIESTILKGIEIRGITPNLVLIFLVTYSILRGSRSASKLGIFIGILQDVFFCKILGFYTLVYFLIGFFAGYFNKDFYKDNYILPLILITICDFIYGFLVYSFTYLFRGRIEMSYYILNIVLPEMVYTMMLSLFFYRLIYVIDDKISIFERKYKHLS